MIYTPIVILSGADDSQIIRVRKFLPNIVHLYQQGEREKFRDLFTGNYPGLVF